MPRQRIHFHFLAIVNASLHELLLSQSAETPSPPPISLNSYISQGKKKKKLFPYLSQPFSVMHEQVMGCFHLHESFISRFTAQLHLLTLSPTLNTQNAFPPQEDYALNLPGVSNKSDK